MSALWIIWSIFVISFLAVLILLSGRGSFLISGFNLKTAAEKAQYDLKKVSRQAGITMLFVSMAILTMALYTTFRIIPAEQAGLIESMKSEITTAALLFSGVVIIAVGITVVRGTKRYKK